MAATESTMLALGTAAPAFSLLDFDGKHYSLTDFKDSKGVVVAFISNHCPFVKHLRDQFAAFAREYQAKNIATVAITSNDLEAYPQDGPKEMKQAATTAGFSFPYLIDETQAVAKLYQAACTPDFFLFDGDRRLIYRGQFDASRPSNQVPVTGKDLRAACDALLMGTPVAKDQVPSIGCNIKWKPGNEPGYAR